MLVDRFTNQESLTNRRRGSMFIETAIGIALAVVVMIAVAQLVALVARQRREVSQTRSANQEVANVMERVMVLPWDELTTETTARFELPDESAVGLDDPQLSITVTDAEGPPSSKTIEVALAWRDQADRLVDPVRLVAWRHQFSAGE